jgi:hypothetical protein
MKDRDVKKSYHNENSRSHNIPDSYIRKREMDSAEKGKDKKKLCL